MFAVLLCKMPPSPSMQTTRKLQDIAQRDTMMVHAMEDGDQRRHKPSSIGDRQNKGDILPQEEITVFNKPVQWIISPRSSPAVPTD